MAAHYELGKQGEQAAADYLQGKGYHVLHRNWHYRHKEIDIVAEKDGVLVIVEVKTRKNNLFGNPEEAVNGKKIRRIVSSADAYIKKFAIDLPVRFDIITVLQDGEKEHLEHIESAFLPPVF